MENILKMEYILIYFGNNPNFVYLIAVRAAYLCKIL